MKKIYLILIFLIPLFITACAPSRGLTSSGPNGIQIRFLQPNFPGDALKDEGDQIAVLLEVTNHAECDAIGRICVGDGGLSDDFGGFNKNRDCKLLDIPRAVREDGRLNVDTEKFVFTSRPYENLFSDIDVNINAIANYRCDVFMSSRVCVASPLDETSQCNSFEAITGSKLEAKAAPVTLSKIEKTISLQDNGLKLKTALTLRKMNKGLVIDENDNTQLILEVNYGGSNMECKHRDYKDGLLLWKPDEPEKIINCEILLSNQELNDPLTVHLVYNYEISEETRPIRIEAREEVAF